MTGELERGAGPRRTTDIVDDGSSEGGGFVYDEATLHALVMKWVELADDYFASTREVDLCSTSGPGLDPASEAHALAANRSGEAYQVYLRRNFEYCVQQAQLLQNTLDDYLGQEHRSVTEFMKARPGAGI